MCDLFLSVAVGKSYDVDVSLPVVGLEYQTARPTSNHRSCRQRDVIRLSCECWHVIAHEFVDVYKVEIIRWSFWQASKGRLICIQHTVVFIVWEVYTHTVTL